MELAGNLDQAERKILVNAPVALFVGIRQCAVGDHATDAQMVQLDRLRPQAGFDIPQAFVISQLGEGHAQELVEVGECERRVAAWILRPAAAECVQRHMFHQLSEYQFSRMHWSTLGKSR